MRFVPNYIIRACFIILCLPVCAQAQDGETYTIPLFYGDEEKAHNDEIKQWLNRSNLDGSFAYFKLKRDVAPTNEEGHKYLVFSGKEIRVYGNPKKNKNGLLVYRYRSPDVPGCYEQTCVMALKPGYLEQTSGYKTPTGQLWDTFKNAVTFGGSDVTPCKGCGHSITVEIRKPIKSPPQKEVSLPKEPRPASVNAKALDKSIAWMRNYMECDKYNYLVSQRQNLLDAEKIFGVPAPIIACLIGRESRWDMTAVQMNPRDGKMWGSFKGLPQTREASLETERNYHNTDNPYYRREARQRLNAYLQNYIAGKGTSIGQLKEDNIHYKTSSYSNGSRWERCGPPISTAQGDRIGRTSIAFVATYLSRTADGEVAILQSKGRHAEARSLMNSPIAKYLMAAGGYNAGSGHTFEMTPKEAYSSNNGSWIANMHRPPFLADARKRVQNTCTAKQRAVADKAPLKRSKVIKKAKGKTVASVVVQKRSDVYCSSAWVQARLNNINVRKLTQQAEEKFQEVRPYVKWIDTCRVGDQNQSPPTKGPSLTDPRYLERKNDGCYKSDPLKPCPPLKPKSKPKGKK